MPTTITTPTIITLITHHHHLLHLCIMLIHLKDNGLLGWCPWLWLLMLLCSLLSCLSIIVLKITLVLMLVLLVFLGVSLFNPSNRILFWVLLLTRKFPSFLIYSLLSLSSILWVHVHEALFSFCIIRLWLSCFSSKNFDQHT